MVLMLTAQVNVNGPPSQTPSSLRHASSRGDGSPGSLHELEGSPLGLARIAENLTIHRIEPVGRGKKTKTTGIANHDAGCL